MNLPSGQDALKTIDNVSCRLGDDIAERLGTDSTVYVSSSGFSLSAFEHLAEGLANRLGMAALGRLAHPEVGAPGGEPVEVPGRERDVGARRGGSQGGCKQR